MCVVPFGFDALVAVLSARHGEIFWIFPPIVTAASLVGAALTYWIGQTAGDAGLPRLVPARYLERMKARLATTGAGALAAAAVMPPPFPLTAFQSDMRRARLRSTALLPRLRRDAAGSLRSRRAAGTALWQPRCWRCCSGIGFRPRARRSRWWDWRRRPVMGAVLWSRTRQLPA